ncbi:MAG: hypothetical protein Kow0037_14320 [Calditrichia bacterium]
MKILEINGETAVAELEGVRREISIMMLPEVKNGEYVMVHAGFAIERLDEKEASQTLQLLREMGDLDFENAAEEDDTTARFLKSKTDPKQAD